MSGTGQDESGSLIDDAKARLSRGADLVRAGDDEAALAIYAEVAERFASATDAELRRQAALASLRRGYHLVRKLERREEAIAVYDSLAGEYSSSTDTGTQEIVAQALLNRANALEALDRLDEAGAGWADVARDFAGMSRDDVAAVLAVVIHEPRAARHVLYLGAGDEPVEWAVTAVLAA